MLDSRLKEKLGMNIKSSDINLEWKSDKSKLLVTLPTYDEAVYEFFNQDEYSIKTVANALKKIYLYDGEFYFNDFWDNDIPF